MKTFAYSAILAALAATAAAPAAIINVPGNQPDIQSAIAAAAVSGDEIVVAPGIYTGTLEITGKSLTLRGSDPSNRPVFAFTTQTTGNALSAGMLIRGDGTSVTVQDMVFLPGAGFGATAKGVYVNPATAGQTVNITLRNLLFAPNNGANAPLLSDPLDNTTPIPAADDWPNDILYLSGRSFLAGMNAGILVATVEDVTMIGAGRDGFICYPGSIGASLTGSGVAISRSARNGIQFGDTTDTTADIPFTFTGSRANPGLLLNNNHTATAATVGVAGFNGGGVITLDHLVVANGTSSLNAPGLIMTADNLGGVTITNALVAGNTASGIRFAGSTQTKTNPVAISDSTFYGNAQSIVIDGTAGEPTYTVTDSIFAGAGVAVNVAVSAAGQLTLSNNALVAAGPDALTEAFLTGAGTPANNGPVFADPQFASTDISTLAALATAFDVQNSLPYYAASSTAGALNGWGDGPVAPSASGSWSIYE